MTAPANPPRPRYSWCAAIVLLALGSGWAAFALVARVTPALFPGEALPLATDLPPVLDALEIRSPGPDSVFNEPIVILVAAADTRPGLPLEAVNTDAIMLVRLDPVRKDLRVLSIPRDLLITVTHDDGAREQARVNMSFALGARDGRAAGMAHLRDDLEREFDVEIDHWALVDFRGAARLIDAIGGVDVVIPEELAIQDWWYSDDDVSHRQLDFDAGPRRLDGYHAVAFARLRALDDDLHRIRRQQIVLEAAVYQAFANGLSNNLLELWNAYGSAIATDVPRSRMPGYARLLSQTGGALQTYSLADPVDGSPSVQDVVLPSGAAVLVGVPDQVQHWLDLVFGSSHRGSVAVAGR